MDKQRETPIGARTNRGLKSAPLLTGARVRSMVLEVLEDLSSQERSSLLGNWPQTRSFRS